MRYKPIVPTLPQPLKKAVDYEPIVINIFRAAFLLTENKLTKQARTLINEIQPGPAYDLAFAINEGNRKDKTAILIRYVFRAIEVNPDMNWYKDMRSMREKLLKVDWDEFIRLYDIYRRKPYNRCPCKPLPLFPCP